MFRYFWLFIFILSCSGEHQQNTKNDSILIDSFETALPHGQSLGELELNDEDKIKLAEAKGIQSQSIQLDSLLQMIEQDSTGLVIYSFWNLDCTECLTNNKLLKALKYNEFDENTFELVYVNTDPTYPQMVKSYIRENNLIDKSVSIIPDSTDNWTLKVEQGWEGQIPALLLINNLDGTRLFYQKLFSYAELQTVILPLTL